MTTNSFYDRVIRDGKPEDLSKTVLNILSEALVDGERVDRKVLVERAFDQPTNSTNDRKVRRAIEELRQQGYCILSDSGEGGYWFGNPIERECFILELESRRERLAETIRALRNPPQVHFSNIPAKQVSLFA